MRRTTFAVMRDSLSSQTSTARRLSEIDCKREVELFLVYLLDSAGYSDQSVVAWSFRVAFQGSFLK